MPDCAVEMEVVVTFVVVVGCSSITGRLCCGTLPFLTHFLIDLLSLSLALPLFFLFLFGVFVDPGTGHW